MFNVAKFVSGRSCLVRSRGNLQLAARNFSVLTPFKLADIGEGIAEVELMKWFVKVINFALCKFFIFDQYCYRKGTP